MVLNMAGFLPDVAGLVLSFGGAGIAGIRTTRPSLGAACASRLRDFPQVTVGLGA
jgi:hypothetical protein